MVSADEAKAILTRNGYTMAFVEGERWFALYRFMWTWAILSGPLATVETGYEDRWCFHDMGDAIRALAEWNARELEGEPEGWHRHTPSNRRRDPATGKEWIAA